MFLRLLRSAAGGFASFAKLPETAPKNLIFDFLILNFDLSRVGTLTVSQFEIHFRLIHHIKPYFAKKSQG
jgi:hypothetical protein